MFYRMGNGVSGSVDVAREQDIMANRCGRSEERARYKWIWWVVMFGIWNGTVPSGLQVLKLRRRDRDWVDFDQENLVKDRKRRRAGQGKAGCIYCILSAELGSC